jgi:hypothetical protein
MQPTLRDCDRGTRIALRVVVALLDGTIPDTALYATCLNEAARTLPSSICTRDSTKKTRKTSMSSDCLPHPQPQQSRYPGGN